MNKRFYLARLTLVGTLVATPVFGAHIRDFQTTRLSSTAGAGVASILSTEAAILNPATSVFFEGNSASYQSYTTSLREKNTLRDTNNDSFAKQNRSQGVFLSDSSSGIKGGAAYIQQNENRFHRQRMVLHGASSMGPKSSMGVTYNYLQDENPKTVRDRHQTHHQLSLGMIHFVDDQTVLGLVLTDPTRTTPGEERLLAGFQYQLAPRFVVIGDVGARYTKSFSENYLWRAALQVNIFSDFFIRGGQFYDKTTESKGTGWGASWIGPRFGVEFAQKVSDYYGKTNYVYKNEKLVDTSLSAIMKF